MSRTTRLYKLKQILEARRCAPRDVLERELEVSRATLKRDIELLRSQLHVPLTWDREQRGWRLDRDGATGRQVELPGMWINEEESRALLTMQQLLASLDAGGLLGRHIEPMRKRLRQMLAASAPPEAEVERRIKVMTVGARKVHMPHFQSVASALLRRRRMVLVYRGRSRADSTEREVSPQRLVHYRDNWYLDAWCHWREALRSFAVDAIERAGVLEQTASDVPDAELDDVLGAGYGIFAGRQVQWARLRFSAERSRWVSAERWHPHQRGQFDAEGRWLLDLPYADPRELVMDVLRHVPDVQVLWPEELAAEVRRRLVEGVRVLDE